MDLIYSINTPLWESLFTSCSINLLKKKARILNHKVTSNTEVQTEDLGKFFGGIFSSITMPQGEIREVVMKIRYDILI